ncbi:MAG: hypothetical protein JWL63_2265 [Rhodocyclales bacterium]|nr:hypothetical protein [Rhodocyclales bacterium]
MRYSSRHAPHRAKAAQGAARSAAGGAQAGHSFPRFLRDSPALLAGESVPTSTGRPLPEKLRREFEIGDEGGNKIGGGGVPDLSAVRIHDGAEADALTAQKGARAFTVAQDIYFRSGEFAPQREDGRRLLAHELTHTLQQRSNGSSGELDVSMPGDYHEREADTQAAGWLRGEAPSVSHAPQGVLQREPDPQAPVEELNKDKKPVKPAANLLTADQASALKPPQYTTYFDEVVPGILQGVEANGEVPYEHAMWLITQSYGEQSPLSVHEDKSVSYPLPSEHHNRLFNEHASMEEDPKTHVKTPVPGQEHDGAHLYNLEQKEFLNGKWVTTNSPTFGYDSTADSTRHHLALLKERRPAVYESLTQGKSFDGFVDSLNASGYATDPAYATKLKALQGQVNSQVTAWLQFRVPSMRERIEKLETYMQTLNESLAGWQEKFSGEAEDILEATLQCVKFLFLIITTAMEIEQTQSDLARLERFAGGIKVKLPEQPQE